MKSGYSKKLCSFFFVFVVDLVFKCIFKYPFVLG